MPRPGWFASLAALALACLLSAPCSAARDRVRRLQQAAVPPAPVAAALAGAAAGNTTACVFCSQLAAIGFSSNLPVVVLDTQGGKLEEKGKNITVRVCTCGEGECRRQLQPAGL
ncbi:hypothetical protein ABPG75_011364 [Micractinium tetrahymenae]